MSVLGRDYRWMIQPGRVLTLAGVGAAEGCVSAWQAAA